jgi:hypothetical protein
MVTTDGSTWSATLVAEHAPADPESVDQAKCTMTAPINPPTIAATSAATSNGHPRRLCLGGASALMGPPNDAVQLRPNSTGAPC